VLTLSAVAEKKKISMQKLEVQVGCLTENGTSPSTRFTIGIDVGVGLTHRERAILFNSARHCEVGKILSGTIEIELRYANLETLRHPPHDGGRKYGHGRNPA
jgi:uncharacterized OsmC-like protein